MPYFKMVRQALPAKTVADARQLANDVCRRNAVGKFSVASEWTNATERQRALGIAEVFLNGPAADLFRSRFDVEPALCLNIMTVRHQAPEGAAEAVGWHLDLGFVGDDSPFLVSWTALQDVGRDRPGLEVCVPAGSGHNLTSLLEAWRQRRLSNGSLVFDDRDLDEHLGQGGWQARVAHATEGDAAVFDQLVLHRTQPMTGVFQERHSIEFRMMSLDALPMYQRTQTAIFAQRSTEGGVRLYKAVNGNPLTMTLDAFCTLEIHAG